VESFTGEQRARPGRRPESSRVHRAALRARGAPVVDASAPAERDAHEYWFLAQACIAARAYAKALEFAEAGLARAPRDWTLIATRGDARSGLSDDEGAAADWQLALELHRDEAAEPDPEPEPAA
jgi:hypothetical protein